MGHLVVKYGTKHSSLESVGPSRECQNQWTMNRAAPPVVVSFNLDLFGEFRLERSGETVRLPTRKTESLLAFLVLHPQTHTREKLAALFWGDSSDAQARHSLRFALSALRKTLGTALLIADRDLVQLNPRFPLQVDVNEFMDIVETIRGTVANHAELLSLHSYATRLDEYRGELLEGWYDDWILPEREYYRQLYLDTLMQLTQFYRSASEYALAVEAAQRILQNDPANERAHQHLMFCYIAQGNRHAALMQYGQCVVALRESLAVTPTTETSLLYEWIKQARSEARSTAAQITNLPFPLSSFIGRTREISKLKELVDHTRLLTLTGAGGSGKTRLAIQVATDLIDKFSDGVWWVNLAPLTDEALVPEAMGQALGVSESPSQSLTEVLNNFLREKQLLLILDNCEHLITACAQIINELLTRCANLKILATSREALRVTGESIFQVPTLSLPEVQRLSLTDLLMQYEGIRLFVERARAVKPDFALTDQNATEVAQICQRLDGIPLAIELAAARTNMLSIGQIATRLDDRFNLLTNGSRTAMPRQRTLRAAIDWSYELLTEAEQILFRRLSVFAGGFTLDSMQTICADENLASQITLDQLERLIDQSLVLVETPDDGVRYRMLETLRQYAHERLLESNEIEPVRTRHSQYYVHFAEEIEPKLRGPEQVHWLDLLEKEQDNFRAVFGYASGKERVEQGLRLAVALRAFWELRAHRTEGRLYVETLLQSPEAAPRTILRSNALWTASMMNSYLGDGAAEREYREEMVAVARLHGLAGRRELIIGLAGLGQQVAFDDPERAQALHDEGQRVAEELGDEWTLAFFLRSSGRRLLNLNDLPRAIQKLQTATELFQKVGDRWLAATTVYWIARANFLQGNPGLARGQVEQNLIFLGEAGYRFELFQNLNLLGEIARLEVDFERASHHHSEALSIARDMGYKIQMQIAMVNLGFDVLELGDAERAKTLFTDALKVLNESLPQGRDTLELAILIVCLRGFACLAAQQGQPRRSAQLFGSTEHLLSPLGESRTTSMTNPADDAAYERGVAYARAKLDEATFNAAWGEGRALTLQQTVDYALDESK